MKIFVGFLEAVLNWSEKDQKIAQSTHENGYIKPRKTFWRNSKQLLINNRVGRIFTSLLLVLFYYRCNWLFGFGEDLSSAFHLQFV